MDCDPAKFHWRFRGTYCLHFQGRRIVWFTLWHWRHYVLPKRRWTYIGLHNMKSQETVLPKIYVTLCEQPIKKTRIFSASLDSVALATSRASLRNHYRKVEHLRILRERKLLPEQSHVVSWHILTEDSKEDNKIWLVSCIHKKIKLFTGNQSLLLHSIPSSTTRKSFVQIHPHACNCTQMHSGSVSTQSWQLHNICPRNTFKAFVLLWYLSFGFLHRSLGV